jgi:hypothetical protein
MREDDLRKILLVKAVEEADREGTLVPAADRAAAGREAVRNAGSDASPGHLLAARASTLLDCIVARHPFIADVMALLGPMPALTLGMALAGFALGASISLLDGPRQINVLAIPVGGVVLWNFAVYAWLFFARVRRRPPGAPTTWLAALVSRPASRLVSGSRAFNAQLAEALQAFIAQWLEASRPLLIARATTAFHLAAAALGAGIIASLYVRGLVFDYRAVWESTFLDADQARAVLAVLYGPASWLTGIAVPGAAELEAARARAGTPGGEPAARWIHLIAASVLIYVIVPRLALALASALKATRLALRAPEPATLPAYFRSAFAAVEGAVARATAIVMPYACELSPGALARLIAWVPGAAGGPVAVEARDGVPYGEEAHYLETFGARGGDRADIVVLPFNLAATPEAENHGAVIAGVRDRLASARPGARLLVVVDEAPYAERMAATPERLSERREAWRSFVRAHGLEPAFVSLAP